MAGKSSNYSILVDCELNLKDIDSQLKSKKYGINLDTSSVKSGQRDLDSAAQSTQKLDDSTKDLMFTYQQYRQVLDSVVDITEKMYQSVKTLDDAQTELKKVSDLQGQALDNYTKKLSESGKTVARTGKPNRSEPVCTDGKCA